MALETLETDRARFETAGRAHPALLLLLVAALATAPAVILGFPASHSLHVNLSWHLGFSEQLMSGIIYPRWIPALNFGLGGPVFFFYPPLVFYVSSLVDLLTMTLLPTRHVLGLTAFVVLFLSGLSCFAWFRQFAGRGLAGSGAAFYMIMPYHLGIDLYERGAIAEYFAYAFIPLVFLSIRLSAGNRRHAFLFPAISYFALILCHLPTAVLVAPFALAYVLMEARQAHSTAVAGLNGMARTTLSLLAGFSLSSVYLVPALSGQDFITSSVWWTGYYHYAKWFLLAPETWQNPPLMTQIQYFAVTGLCLISVLFAYIWRRNRRFPRHLAFWFAGFLLAFFLMTPAASLVWKVLTPLQKVQFPWRLMAVAEFFFATAVVLALQQFMARGKALTIPIKVWLGVLILLWLPVSVMANRDNMLSWVSSAEHFADVQTNVESGFGGYEYVPGEAEVWADGSPYRTLPEVEIISGAGEVTIDKAGRQIVLFAEMAEAGTVALKSFYYSGWTIRDIEGQQDAIILGADALGRITLSLPSGRSDLVLVLERSRAEVSGLLLSALSIILLGGLTLVIGRTGGNPRRP